MARTLFAEKIFTGDGVLDNQVIRVTNGMIDSIEPGFDADSKTEYLSAGFFDIHINGGEQYYLSKTPSVEAVEDIACSCSDLGTAYTLPTLITSPLDNIFRGIGSVKEFMKNNPSGGVVGMHLEGPFLHPVKRGAHLAEYLQIPTTKMLQEIIREGEGIIKLMTIAPELFTEDQLMMLQESGIVLSAGHSNATYAQSQEAFKSGIHLVTHLYNAMSGFSHRAPGLTGAALDNGKVYAPVILDGVHCDYAAARIAYKIKKDKLFLISDALFTGDKIKHFEWGNYNACLQDGKYINSEGNLTGSAISLGDAVRNAVNKLGIEIQEAVEMATIRPALALHLADFMGRVQKGYPAVFTSFDKELREFKVIRL